MKLMKKNPKNRKFKNNSTEEWVVAQGAFGAIIHIAR